MFLIEFVGNIAFDTLRTDNHLAHDLGHQWLSLVGSLLNLLVANLYGNIEAAQVSDNTDTEGADAAVVGYDNLRNGTHTYCIRIIAG